MSSRGVICLCLMLCALPGISQDLETLLRQEQSNLPNQKLEATKAIAAYYFNARAFLKSADYWNKAISLERENSDQPSVQSILGLAKSLSLSQQYRSALTPYQEVFRRYRELDSTTYAGTMLEHVHALEQTEQYKEAIELYSIWIQRQAVIKNIPAYVAMLNHMGVLEKKQNRTSEAFDFFTNARVAMEQHVAEVKPVLQYDVYCNLAVAHAAKSEFLTAQFYFTKAEAMASLTAIDNARVQNLKGATYLLMNKLDEAQKAGIEALTILDTDASLEAQRLKAESYSLLAYLNKDRDPQAYQIYTDLLQQQQNKINQQMQAIEEDRLRQSIEVEKRENELLSKIAIDERIANETRQLALESERTNQNLELKVRDLDLKRQLEEIARIQLERQLLLRQQQEQKLLLEKQALESSNKQKEFDRQELIQLKDRQELELVRNQKKLADQQLEDAAERERFVMLVAIMTGVVLLLVVIGVITLLRNRSRLLQKNRLIGNQKMEIEKQNHEINETIGRLTLAQATIESQNNRLKDYNETLANQVAERTQQLVETNKELTQNNQQLEQYSYMTAHNLRGPVARLLGLTAIFGKLDVRTDQEIVEKVHREASSLDTLIKDLNSILQVRKANEELIQVIDIKTAIPGAIKILQQDIEEVNANISYDFAKAPSVTFVPTYFENIMYNLVSNAIKYRNADRALVIQISSDVDATYTVIKVVDNGLGIDLEKNRGNIFGLYKRFHFHKDGKGIGLYLVKAQIESIGGKIVVESQPDMGTTFTLYFPIKQVKKG